LIGPTDHNGRYAWIVEARPTPSFGDAMWPGIDETRITVDDQTTIILRIEGLVGGALVASESVDTLEVDVPLADALWRWSE